VSQQCAFALEEIETSAGAVVLQRQFETSPYWSVRRLTCALSDGRIVLRGTVPCYYLKQVAHTLALKTVGVGRIDSDIKVESN
jgi:hypothetical protein